MKRKIFSIVLVLMMIASVVPLGMLDVYAANVTINGIDLGYSDGSYFTKNGEACTCHGRGTCGDAWDCNCKVVSGACQCYGWSLWVENKLFGSNEISNPSNFETVFSNYTNCTGSGLYSKMNGNVGIGSHIRTNSSKKGYAHSVSIISFDSNGINITDCNHSGKCQVDVRYYSWDSFATFMNGYGGISFVTTCNNAPNTNDPVDLGDDFCAIILQRQAWIPLVCDSDKMVRLHTEQGLAKERWKFKRQEDGSYVILSMETGNALEMYCGERVGGITVAACNPDWGGAYQRWFIYEQDNGYVIMSKHYSSEEWVLDLRHDQKTDGTDVIIYPRSNSDVQIWAIYKTEPQVDVASGTYKIHSAWDDNKYLDIAGYSKEDRANIQLYEKEGSNLQEFRVKKYDGYYTIQSVYSGKYLDIRTPISNNSNVQLWWSNQNIEEKWVFEKAENGLVYIKSLTGYYLDVQGDKAINNANIQVYEFMGNNSQKWRLEKVVYPKPILTTDKTKATTSEYVTFTYSQVENADSVKFFYERNGSVVNSEVIDKSGTYLRQFKTIGPYKVYIGAKYGDEWVYSDKITINVLEHNFVNGFCTECGKADHTINLFGDYNFDGEVNNIDSLAVTKIDNGSISATDEVKFRMDINADGLVDNEDAEIIIAYVNGKINKSDWQVYNQFTGFSIKTAPKTNYCLGESFDSTGMVLQANYKNGTTHTVSSGYTISGYNPGKLGEQTVTVNYYGYITTLTVKCVKPSDSNGDGKIDAQDLIVLRKALLTDTEFSKILDANSDGVVDIRDLVRLKKYIAYNTVSSEN